MVIIERSGIRRKLGKTINMPSSLMLFIDNIHYEQNKTTTNMFITINYVLALLAIPLV